MPWLPHHVWNQAGWVLLGVWIGCISITITVLGLFAAFFDTHSASAFDANNPAWRLLLGTVAGSTGMLMLFALFRWLEH